jgi:outer membrane protein OmpA-like peptidoglycan-associated protein
MGNLMRQCGATLLVVSALGCQGFFNSGIEYDSGGNSATGAHLGAIINPSTTGARNATENGVGARATDFNDDAEELARVQQEEREQVAVENARLMQELQNRGIDVRESERGVVINLPDILFQSGKSELTQAAREVVGEIATILKTAPRRFIAVEGHTDSLGTIEYNYRLSDARARGVVSDLEASGIPARLITMRAFGETTPIASNKSEQGRMRNRRVEVIIENKWSVR